MYNYTNKWYEKDSIEQLNNIPSEKIIVFDTETTGLNPYGNDEILQLAILNGNGEELFNSYIKPVMRKTWTKAAEINGITPRMVKNAPTFEEVEEQVQEIFNNAELIVGYNVEFDIRFINASGIKLKKKQLIFDVMQEYACARGQINGYYGDYKWSKLEQCARDYKYKFDAHDALEDTKATLHCYKSLLEDDRYLNVISENKKEKERIEAEKARIEEQRRIEAEKAEEQRRAEEEKRRIREERKQVIIEKTEKPRNVLGIILLIVGILWIALITLGGLSSVGIGYTLLFDVPGIIVVLIGLRLKKKNKNNNG